jgi:hypothetical protein
LQNIDLDEQKGAGKWKLKILKTNFSVACMENPQNTADFFKSIAEHAARF